MTCRPVTSVLMGDRQTATVHFYCGACELSRVELITGVDIHPPLRFTAAIRRLHERGAWPPVVEDLGDAQAAGWGAPKIEEVA